MSQLARFTVRTFYPSLTQTVWFCTHWLYTGLWLIVVQRKIMNSMRMLRTPVNLAVYVV